MTNMDSVSDDLEDEEFSDKVGELVDVLGGILDGESRKNFPELIEYLDELSEREADEDDYEE